MSLAIRLANAGDAGAVLELWRLAATVTTRTDNEASLRSLIARDPEALLLAEDEGELVGAVIAAFDG
jgi:predicted N-acetyltransferase YhbS